MNIVYRVYKISVRAEFNSRHNVVSEVLWGVEFSEDNFKSLATVNTLLDLDDLSNFVPVEQLQKTQILDWCIAAHGGPQFLEQLALHHAEQINDQKRRVELEVYGGELSFSLDSFMRIPVTEL